MKVFLDTNVLVAAFATRGLCADVLRTILAEHELVIGEAVLAELERVLHRKLRLNRKIISEIITLLRRYHVEPVPKEAPDFSLLSPEDRTVLGAAYAAQVDIFVTGDQDLLTFNDQVPFEVTDPRGFWNRAKGRKK